MDLYTFLFGDGTYALAIADAVAAAIIGGLSGFGQSILGSKQRGEDRELSREQFFNQLLAELLSTKESATQGREALRQRREQTQQGAPFRKGAANILLNKERPKRTDLSSVFGAVEDNPFFEQPDDEALGLDPGGGFRLPGGVDLDTFDVPVTDEEVGLPPVDEGFEDLEGIARAGSGIDQQNFEQAFQEEFKRLVDEHKARTGSKPSIGDSIRIMQEATRLAREKVGI